MMMTKVGIEFKETTRVNIKCKRKCKERKKITQEKLNLIKIYDP